MVDQSDTSITLTNGTDTTKEEGGSGRKNKVVKNNNVRNNRIEIS